MNPRFQLLAASLALWLAGGNALAQPAGASAPTAPARKQAEPAATSRDAAPKEAATKEAPKESLADQVRAILEKEKNAIPSSVRRSQKPPPMPVITVDVSRRSAARAAAAPADPGNAPPMEPRLSQQYQRARAVALTGHVPAALIEPRMGANRVPVPVAAAHAAGRPGSQVAGHWAYAGETGPQAWDKLNPDFKLCAAGKRQSPIHIDGNSTLVGPAEPLQFNYQPSAGSVVNNGHTLQVDVEGDNALTVRGTTYKLVQFHFHHPAEERVNQRSFAMVAHLVHRNAEGQLAVVAILMDPGETSPLIDKVWTYLPLEVSDRVRVPAGVIDLNELLPKDQRYYQFMGSLTTPPCSEGVLWMVLKTPVSLGAGQLKLFSQLFPNNARPVQALNGRVVREAQ